MAALPFSFQPGDVVAVAGSRQLSAANAPLVSRVCFALASAGARVSVGCCVGVDKCVMSSHPLGALHVFAAFGDGGVGASSVSAVSAVSRAAAGGSRVSFWAGGDAGVPMRSRLALRTHAVVSAASAGAVLFFSSPVSRGTLLAGRLAAARVLPVVAFALDFDAAQLPLLGVGRWVSCGTTSVWSKAWKWEASQIRLFS